MKDRHALGYLRTAAVVPEVFIGNPDKNTEKIMLWMDRAEAEQADVVVFPELSVTGYTCADMFFQETLLGASDHAVSQITAHSKGKKMLVVIGAPLRVHGVLFNVAYAIYDGEILGIVPKSYMPNYSEFYELRWFKPYTDAILADTVLIGGKEIPFGPELYFDFEGMHTCIAIEICEDLFVPNSPSVTHGLNGANVVLNLSASDELVGKADYRKSLLEAQTTKSVMAYVYVSAGMSESTTDLLFGGHTMIYENGTLLSESRFEEDHMILSDIDVEALNIRRMRTTSIDSRLGGRHIRMTHPGSVGLASEETFYESPILRHINAYPFVPFHGEGVERGKVLLSDIFSIQYMGLATRLKKTGIKRSILGISGGLDSTLALLVTAEAYRYLGRDPKDIVAVTMPGYGTTGRTKGNADSLMAEFGVTSLTIPIHEVCEQQFKDLNHDPSLHDITYENVQARQRTANLMNLSNKENGLVIGTGDLSELALGWCTYNGDHMSMYNVNASIPKTLVKYLVQWYATFKAGGALKAVLEDILDTPISPELLPPDENGNLVQKTEEKLGKYDIHDFILYHLMRNGAGPEKIYFQLLRAFDDLAPKQLLEQMKVFYRRFFTQQFKRSTLPDGVKVGTVSLSPRGDWRMPSDMEYTLWMKELDQISASLHAE
jgi:NAD+ synthase (glutamine-hydrolysing)